LAVCDKAVFSMPWSISKRLLDSVINHLKLETSIEDILYKLTRNVVHKIVSDNVKCSTVRGIVFNFHNVFLSESYHFFLSVIWLKFVMLRSPRVLEAIRDVPQKGPTCFFQQL